MNKLDAFLRRLQNILAANWSVAVTLAVLAIFFVLSILRILFPETLEFLIEHHVFESVMVLAVVSLMLQVLQLGQQKGYEVITDEVVVRERIRKSVEDMSDITEAWVLSTGLGYRKHIIEDLARQKKKVVALVQDPSSAPDKGDAQRLMGELDIRKRPENVEFREHVKILAYTEYASLRCVILLDRAQRVLAAAIGWFTYHSGNQRVAGRRNPSIYVRRTDPGANQLFDFAKAIFQEYRTSANLLYPEDTATPVAKTPDAEPNRAEEGSGADAV